jgi:hypothetical protein
MWIYININILKSHSITRGYQLVSEERNHRLDSGNWSGGFQATTNVNTDIVLFFWWHIQNKRIFEHKENSFLQVTQPRKRLWSLMCQVFRKDSGLNVWCSDCSLVLYLMQRIFSKRITVVWLYVPASRLWCLVCFSARLFLPSPLPYDSPPAFSTTATGQVQGLQFSVLRRLLVLYRTLPGLANSTTACSTALP